jgi:hypothetical protein
MGLIHIKGNVLGFAMFVAAGLVAGAGGLLLKLPDAPVMIAVGISLIVMDMIIRLRSRPQKGWLMAKDQGGYLFFIPVWALGIVVIAINIINTFNPIA